jgi:DMSO reductase family type II enzyme heme b subunit
MTGCGPAAPPAPQQDVSIIPATALPEKPGDQAWNQAPEFVAKMLLQDMVEPRQLAPTTAEVRVRALGLGNDAAFRIEWNDATRDEVAKMSEFCDACAVQVPEKVEPAVPAPQMGEVGKAVEITYWNAGWQAVVNGREDSIKALYPNAAIDHYPFEAEPLKKTPNEQREMAARYAPARNLGNAMSGPRTTPVQDLVAAGPGTLTPAAQTTSKGLGERTATGWAVVIRRRLPAGITPQLGSQVAFAVWDGSQQEVGARKMRTAWIPLTLKAK